MESLLRRRTVDAAPATFEVVDLKQDSVADTYLPFLYWRGQRDQCGAWSRNSPLPGINSCYPPVHSGSSKFKKLVPNLATNNTVCHDLSAVSHICLVDFGRGFNFEFSSSCTLAPSVKLFRSCSHVQGRFRETITVSAHCGVCAARIINSFQCTTNSILIKSSLLTRDNTQVANRLGYKVGYNARRVWPCNFRFGSDTCGTFSGVHPHDLRFAPVRTRRVESPPFWPNRISVFSLSPIISVRLGSKLTLAQRGK